MLNYRIIGFSFPAAQTANGKYKLEVATGNYFSEDSFNKNITLSVNATCTKAIAKVPAFGSGYTWRVVYGGRHGVAANSPFYHFRTGSIANVDTTQFRFRVLDSAQQYKDNYVFIDDNKTLYDMKGEPVWYLPDINGIAVTPRDLKVTPQGTITLVFDPPYEVNYNGEVLWKAPQEGSVSGDLSEHFHHDFARLASGHYMALGQDSIEWNYPIAGVTNQIKKMQFGTVIEYDEQGKIVWSWKSSGYFASSDLKYYTPPGNKPFIDVHENSFYFDEKNKVIYISYKNISRVLKVKYPEGIVLASYGDTYGPGGVTVSNGLFCGQHAAKHAGQGYLYLYNNNPCDSATLPTVVVMQEPETGKEGLKKIWEYVCTIDGSSDKKKVRYDFSSGGNVEELPDHSYLVSMSSSYGKVLIVSPEKKVLWSALPERWDKTEKKWVTMSEYRASIVQPADLERMIWKGEPAARQDTTK